MLRFNTLLRDAGIDPAEVRLLRHSPKVGGRSLLDIWRSEPETLEAYQAVQLASAQSSFARRYWASFIGTWDGRTVFVGLYEVGGHAAIAEPSPDPISGVLDDAQPRDRYTTTAIDALGDYRGRLYIDWGGGVSGKRAWNQRADAQDKPITELHRDVGEEPFPGLIALTMPLSHLASVPPSWIERMAAAKGIYLLACPRDGSLYVGSATGAGGFWARWSDYRANGHGGNVALINREPSDFIASVLQVAGSTDTYDDIIAAETLWKAKLATRQFGLTRN